jgi:small ligand-binding sensory domain FIST
MICASALSTAKDSAIAIRELVDQVAEGLGGSRGSFAVAFVSSHHAGSLAELGRLCRERGIAEHFVGVTGESIVGDGREIEGDRAASLWAIRLPDAVTVRPMRLTWNGSDVDGLPEDAAAIGAAGRTVLLLGDPFSFPPDALFRSLEASSPGVRVVGGMASGANAPGGNRLALDGDVFDDGAVALIFDGPLAIRTIVSQGCRPVGRSMIVTRAEQNVIRELGRRPAIDVLRETYEELDEGDQALIRDGLHVGRVINEYQDTFGRGDFLVRNVLGADDSGGIAITDQVRVGQTVQFHVRDAETADEDLQSMLADDLKRNPSSEIVGGLLFSCNGRGSRLFASPHHDVGAIRQAYGPIPVAGFFAMGELGPVGGKNFVHGFTASLALFGVGS